jgi:glycosyltransferase involved in cell wall biosynthesis
MRRSKIILARTGDTAKALPNRYAHKVKVVLETAIAEELYSTSIPPIKEDGTDVLQVVYTGRLIALKNVSAAILAVARAIDRGVKLRLLIVGGGPLRHELETLSNRMGIKDSVEFWGVVSQAEAVEALRSSDMYLFPSLKEGGSWSLMEAMAVGLPTICVNASGMAVITDENSAIRVDPISREQLIDGFAEALVELARFPGKRKYLGENAHKRIQEDFQWANKRKFMEALLDELEDI